MAAPELNAEQALGLVSYSLMQRLADQSQDPLPWMNAIHLKETDGLRQLRQRLELTALAIDTGAPLSTNEVTHLLGARPGADVVERGGLRARRGGPHRWGRLGPGPGGLWSRGAEYANQVPAAWWGG